MLSIVLQQQNDIINRLKSSLLYVHVFFAFLLLFSFFLPWGPGSFGRLDILSEWISTGRQLQHSRLFYGDKFCWLIRFMSRHNDDQLGLRIANASIVNELKLLEVLFTSLSGDPWVRRTLSICLYCLYWWAGSECMILLPNNNQNIELLMPASNNKDHFKACRL